MNIPAPFLRLYLINGRLFSDGESGDKDGNYLYKVPDFRHLNTAMKILMTVHNEYGRI